MIPRQKNIASFLLSVVIAACFFAGVHFFGHYFADAMRIVMVFLLAILLLIMLVIAGLTVLKSLFVVAAELSLIIFLGQSYCAVPKHPAAGDNALQGLVIAGLRYIAITFFRSLYKGLQKSYKIVEEDKWSWGKIFTVALYLFFVILFLVDTYQVIKPIIADLCIFKAPVHA